VIRVFPSHWKRIASRGFAWFVTHETYELRDHRKYHWHSRRHRKGRGGLIESDGKLAPIGGYRRMRWWGWEPASMTWWIAVVFTLGSALLIIGSLGPFMPYRVVHSVTFAFLGSTCFTIANYMALLEIINADRTIQAEVDKLESTLPMDTRQDEPITPKIEPAKFHWWGWRPRELSYMATFIMFVGGLLFKLCYVFGVCKWMNWVEVDILINVPGLIGALCFLLSSYLYVVEVVHKPWGVQLHSIAWWIAFTCLLGSLGYTISALYGFFGEGPILIEQEWGNYFAVFLGAIFFFISSYLMIPEALDHPVDEKC
jgi:hypothetical protein